MRYELLHKTVYSYQADVSSSQHVARMAPRDCPAQQVLAHHLEIQPPPDRLETRTDYFGNTAVFFSHETPYRRLEVFSRSTVQVYDPQDELDFPSVSWNEVRSLLQRARVPAGLCDAPEFCHASPLIPRLQDFADYARPSFPDGRPLLEASRELMGRIFRDFSFSPDATTVATPIQEVLAKRQGVCQDFAQVQIACLRALGLAARYVSGYIETLPPPGKTKLVGTDASHAWLSVYCPSLGWVDFDPTNNTTLQGRHITVAWGRDFSDVSPLRGVFVGSGAHELAVGVDVTRLD